MIAPGPDAEVAQKLRIDAACDRFEAQWQAGHRPDLVAFLAESPAADRVPLLLALLAVDAEYRRKAGESPTTAEYRGRFPELSPDDVERVVRDPAGTGADHTPSTLGPARGRSDVPIVPGYEVVRDPETGPVVLGEGGMGIVYLARDVNLGRRVALKMIRGRDRAEARELARFLTEAAAVAAIDHPNVVRVYDYGEHDGHPYMALEYLPGGTLASQIKANLDRTTAGAPFPPRAAASLVQKLASAVQAAHDLGIIHRDLKPANVLFTGHGGRGRDDTLPERLPLEDGPEHRHPDPIPKITDFGLAKRPGTELTGTGAIMGTPSYMAPEQARGDAKFVGPAADVWALGVILYECLTGKRPFTAPDVAVLLTQIRQEDPLPPRSFVPAIPRDLEHVCLKCLEKLPAARYPTAGALAEELQRFTAGEPVSVRPPGLLERTYKWARRKPTLAAAYALAIVAVVLLGFGLSLAALWQDAVNSRRQEQAAREEAESQKAQAVLARDGEQKAREVAEKAKNEAEQARDALQVSDYGGLMQRALQAWRDDDVITARTLLDRAPKALRGWEWDYVHRLCHADRLTLEYDRNHFIRSAEWSQDGRHIRVLNGKAPQAWDAETGNLYLKFGDHKEYLQIVAWSPDGSHVLTAGEKEARIWSGTTGELITRLKDFRGADTFSNGDWNRDGNRVVIVEAKGSCGVWNAKTGERLWTRSDVRDAAWSPDGAKVLTGSKDGWAVRAARDGAPLRTGAVEDGVSNVSWSPDGVRIITASKYKADVRLWAWNDPNTTPIHLGNRWVVAWKPDGKQFLTDGPLGSILDASTGQNALVPLGRVGEVKSAAWDRDGNRIVIGDKSGVVSVWDARAGQLINRFVGHTGLVYSVAFNRDGTEVVSAGEDRTVRIWNTSTQVGMRTYREPAINPCLGWSSLGTHAVFKTYDRKALVEDLENPRAAVLTLTGHTDQITAADWSRQGKLVTGSYDRTARIWDAATGQHLLTLTPDSELISTAQEKPGLIGSDSPLGVVAVAWSRDGSKVAIVRRNRSADVWNAGTGERMSRATQKYPSVECAAWSPDGSRLATGGSKVMLWDAHTGEELALQRGAFYLPEETSTIQCIAWSADGSRIVTGRWAGSADVWDSWRGTRLLQLRGHTKAITSLVWSPDGSRILTGSLDGTARIWDARTGAELLALKEGGELKHVAWPAPGRILTTTVLGRVRTWDAASLNRTISLAEEPPSR